MYFFLNLQEMKDNYFYISIPTYAYNMLNVYADFMYGWYEHWWKTQL